jgi:glycerophosphoryl diester phosphodiesterase
MSYSFPFRRPLVLGHRGACAHAPENTLAAFRMAMEEGADGIELDAHLTRDGEVVVMHDENVERTTNGHGRLSQLTMEEVRRLDAGIRYGDQFSGEHVPTLAGVFEALGDEPVYDLELKNLTNPANGLERKVVDLVRRYGLEKRVLATSFNPLAVRAFRKVIPEAPCGLLLLGGKAGRLEETLIGHWAAPELVGLYHAGLSGRFPVRDVVLVWGPRTPKEVRRSIELGAAGVIVDDPGMARRILAAG